MFDKCEIDSSKNLDVMVVRPHTDRRTTGRRTDGRTDGQTDGASDDNTLGALKGPRVKNNVLVI